MKYLMYSVKDIMTNKYMSPMFTEQSDTSDREAVRQFKSNVLNIPLWKDNPNDYELWKVGIFDDETGTEAIVNEKIIGARSIIE